MQTHLYLHKQNIDIFPLSILGKVLAQALKRCSRCVKLRWAKPHSKTDRQLINRRRWDYLDIGLISMNSYDAAVGVYCSCGGEWLHKNWREKVLSKQNEWGIERWASVMPFK